MNKKICLITGYSHFFGQTRKPWVSINTAQLIAELEAKGYSVSEYSFHQLINSDINIDNSFIFYTFSQRDNLRQYMKDVIHFLQNKGNIVIPDYKLLLCHENKGYQELLKKDLGITSLPALYFSSIRELESYTIEYPIVLKTVDGSNGKGVFLVKSHEHLQKLLSKLEHGLDLFQKFDLLRRLYFRSNKQFQGYDNFDSIADYSEYKDYITAEKRFVLQKFLPGLEFDYRIIILGQHYYVTKRLNRKGDFRASGAKRFTFDFEAEDNLLDYARDIYDKFDSPCLSIDIGVSGKQFYLFEYQALHFGINAIVRGKGCYYYSSQGWEFISQKPCYEKELANALIFYLQRKKY